MNRKLRVAIIGRFGTEAFGLHISETLEANGHSVSRCDPFLDVRLGWYDLNYPVTSVRKLRNHLLREFFSTEHYAKKLASTLGQWSDDYDLILSTHDFLSPLTLQELKRRFSAKLVLWFPDHLARLERGFMLCGLYDALFFKDPFMVQRFHDELGLPNVHYLPECCRADLHAGDESPVSESCDIGTAGNVHTSRAAVLKRLIREGHKITVWGPPVSNWLSPLKKHLDSQPFVANEQKAMAFRSCKIVLNTTHPAEVHGTNVRTFEAAAAGAFQLVNFRPALRELFEPNIELVDFKGIDDLVEKVAHYLNHPEERHRIGAAARKRALQNHTYQHRLEQLLVTIDAT